MCRGTSYHNRFGWAAPIIVIQTSGTVSPEQSFMGGAGNGWVGWSGEYRFHLIFDLSPGKYRIYWAADLVEDGSRRFD